MAKRQKNIKVTTVNEHAIIFYADERHLQDVREIEGIYEVSDLNPPCRVAYLDKRYDKDEIAAEIDALNNEPSIPDVFRA